MLYTKEWKCYPARMMTKTEIVWRHLLVASLDRSVSRHRSVTALAEELGFGISTVHKALQRPAAMGAVQIHGSGGVRVLDPGRLLLLWAGNRNLQRDLVFESSVNLPAPVVERTLPSDRFILGGFGAVVAHERGNRISDYDRVICYGAPDDLPDEVRKGSDGETVVTVLEPDPLLADYGRVTPLAQAYVDLFNTPGWPAERFVSFLNSRILLPRAA